MRATICLSAFLYASSVAAYTGIDAFKRVDRVLEPRAAAQHNAPAHSHERLQKRASRYLNNVTQGECTADKIQRTILTRRKSLLWMVPRSQMLMYVENGIRWRYRLISIQFDIGESYAGLVPISSAANETRKLFFWYVWSRLVPHITILINIQVLPIHQPRCHGRSRDLVRRSSSLVLVRRLIYCL